MKLIPKIDVYYIGGSTNAETLRKNYYNEIIYGKE